MTEPTTGQEPMVQPAAPPTRPQGRYGDGPAAGSHRRALVVTLAVFVVAVLGFAGWVSLERSRSGVNWIELGVVPHGSRSATVSFQVSLPSGRSAVCTVRAVNDALTEVGRTDVVVGPAPTGQVRLSTTVRTAETATGGGVKACVVR